MGFNELVRSIEAPEDRDLVGTSIYYHDQVLDSTPVYHRNIEETINNSRAKNLSSSSISAHIRYLDEDSMIVKEDGGYKLTHEGIEHYGMVTRDSDNGREANFIHLPHIDDQFYTTLVNDINESYRKEIDEATLVLTRKLLENLVIDILRARYGLSDNRRELFYNTNKRQFRSFSKLIENMEENMSDLEYFSDRLDESIISLLRELKNQGNASAHSIEVSPSESAMSEYQEKANQATGILCYTLSTIRDSK